MFFRLLLLYFGEFPTFRRRAQRDVAPRLVDGEYKGAMATMMMKLGKNRTGAMFCSVASGLMPFSTLAK